MNETDEKKMQDHLVKTGGKQFLPDTRIPTVSADVVAPVNRDTFQDLPEAQFSAIMNPHADTIWRKCYGIPLSGRPGIVHIENVAGTVMDTQGGIDKFILPTYSTSKWAVQEKIRRNKFWSDPALRTLPNCPDVTFELKNGNGTFGEWTHNHSMLYLYAWANSTLTGFDAWIIYNTSALKHKVWCENLDILGVGKTMSNLSRSQGGCGGASFQAVPMTYLTEVIMCASQNLRGNELPASATHIRWF